METDCLHKIETDPIHCLVNVGLVVRMILEEGNRDYVRLVQNYGDNKRWWMMHITQEEDVWIATNSSKYFSSLCSFIGLIFDFESGFYTSIVKSIVKYFYCEIKK